jgi:hypothetical protein
MDKPSHDDKRGGEPIEGMGQVSRKYLKRRDAAGTAW